MPREKTKQLCFKHRQSTLKLLCEGMQLEFCIKPIRNSLAIPTYSKVGLFSLSRMQTLELTVPQHVHKKNSSPD